MSRIQGLRAAVPLAQILPDRSLDKLDTFVSLVEKWTPTINLIARGTVDQIWERHLIDSAQVFRLARPEHKVWLDLGSGGGFPGLIVAILAAELAPNLGIVLVESDKRKAVFLREAARSLALHNVKVLAERVEDLQPLRADVVSARALASLDKLCGYASPHLQSDGLCVFLKGAQHEMETAAARENWLFELERVESVTDTQSTLLVLKGLKHV